MTVIDEKTVEMDEEARLDLVEPKTHETVVAKKKKKKKGKRKSKATKVSFEADAQTLADE